MFALFSYIDYEGRILHGIFETEKLARKAMQYMKIDCEYIAQGYIIEKIHINTIIADGGSVESKTFY